MKNSTCTQLLLCFPLIFASACSNPQPGPDKTIGGAVLGAAWGAGTGAVVGHQVEEFSRTGEGVAIGSGIGFVSGAMTGLGFDLVEDTQIEHAKQLEAIQVQNAANRQEIANIQRRLDVLAMRDTANSVYEVYFDEDSTSLRSGSISNLENIANAVKVAPNARYIHIDGHSDDSGDTEHSEKLSEARARAVSSYLASQGVALDQIRIKSYGSKRPVASNNTAEGRQLNRRVDVYITNQ